jgi:hypothetical protein
MIIATRSPVSNLEAEVLEQGLLPKPLATFVDHYGLAMQLLFCSKRMKRANTAGWLDSAIDLIDLRLAREDACLILGSVSREAA